MAVYVSANVAREASVIPFCWLASDAAAGASCRRVTDIGRSSYLFVAVFLLPCAVILGCRPWYRYQESAGAPAAIDRNGRAGDIPAARSAQQSDEGRDAVGFHESSGRLARGHEGFHRLLARQALLFHDGCQAFLDRGRRHRARTDRIAGDVLPGRLEGDGAGEADQRR